MRVPAFTLCIIIFALLSALFISRSFWLDETMTVWVISEDIATLFQRVRDFQGPGVLHFITCWLWSIPFGVSELSLRIPSTVAIFIAAACTARFVSKSMDTESGTFAFGLTLFLPQLFQESVNARCYALAYALAVALILFLVENRLDSPRRFVGSAAMMALIIYCHPLFISLFPLFLLIQLEIPGKPQLPRLLSATSWAILTLILSVGIVPQLLIIAEKGESMGFVRPASGAEFLRVLFPAIPWLALIVSVGAAFLLKLRGLPEKIVNRRFLALGLLVWVTPALSLFAASYLFQRAVFVDRYLLLSQFGLILLMTSIVSLVPASVRTATMCNCIILLILGNYLLGPVTEDWRGAVERVNAEIRSGDCIFAFTGQAEAKNFALLQNPAYQQYLRSPFFPYPLPSEPFLLPVRSWTDEAMGTLQAQLASCRRDLKIWLIVRQMFIETPGQQSWPRSDESWSTLFQLLGYTLEGRTDLASMSVLKLSKRPIAPDLE